MTERHLFGPGPTNVSPPILAALARPTIGHLDPAFLSTMDEISRRLRYCFQTANPLTFVMSAPGTVGMEASLNNLLEPGDTAVICINGVFGGRMQAMVERAGATAITVASAWGTPVDVGAVDAVLSKHPEARVLAFVHAETSTGVRSDAAALAALARRHGVLTIADCVTSLSGVPLAIDEWGIDVAYSGSQKCLACVPGLAPVTFSPQAVERVKARQVPVRSWFADVSLLASYYETGEKSRAYHHTAPVNSLFAIDEALRLVEAETLDVRWQRHADAAAHLYRRLEAAGLELVVAPDARLASLTLVRIPDGVDDAAVRHRLLAERNIELGAGLGQFAGKAWRIGLMGDNATRERADFLVDALLNTLAA